MFDRGSVRLVRLLMFVVFLFFVFSLLFAGFTVSIFVAGMLTCAAQTIFIESLMYQHYIHTCGAETGEMHVGRSEPSGCSLIVGLDNVSEVPAVVRVHARNSACR